MTRGMKLGAYAFSWRSGGKFAAALACLLRQTKMILLVSGDGTVAFAHHRSGVFLPNQAKRTPGPLRSSAGDRLVKGMLTVHIPHRVLHPFITGCLSAHHRLDFNG